MLKKSKKSSIFVTKKSLLFQVDSKNKGSNSDQNFVFKVKDHKKAVIEASAGTGKTFALIELVLELMLEEEIPLKSILLVTFTEKATKELKFRLRNKIRKLLEDFEAPAFLKQVFRNLKTQKMLHQILLSLHAVQFHY